MLITLVVESIVIFTRDFKEVKLNLLVIFCLGEKIVFRTWGYMQRYSAKCILKGIIKQYISTYFTFPISHEINHTRLLFLPSCSCNTTSILL